MAPALSSLDWTLIQSFLAVAEAGSMSAAAQQLGQSQPTVGRHVKALETALGVELFQRHSRGLRLTAMGAQVLPAAEDMRRAMTQIALAAEAEAGTLEGEVRIACSAYAAHYVLPPIIADIRAAEPAISIILHASDDTKNLTFREADIAVRMYRPTQLDLVARHIGELPIGVFAARSYLDRRGRPGSLAELMTHDLVGFDRTRLILEGMKAAGLSVSPSDFATRCDNQSAYWALLRAGCGIGFGQMNVGRSDPLIEEIKIDGVVLPALPVWLTAMETVRRLPRVDRVWQLLVDGLGAVVDRPGS
ncbi:LysR family transcriptional regulator [Aliishimia ponticola]|uniref:LysR family transcriptional regulator n=1 Tax=Aliishimia ponticola TaxID=2499833 RepID=A0A4S4NA80_9RHOB|nr:LysR family transcriptional regulator [Aliishimia ponticola]THH36204.1 LysR family transcriptional regulator [Aliishimia ponticola]